MPDLVQLCLVLFPSMWHVHVVFRGVHGSGRVGFGPNPDPTRRSRVEGGGTRNRPPASLGRVGFGFGWCSGGSVGVESRRILQTSPESARILPESARMSPESAKTQ